ncbi:unnamed protein product [Lymnaea stagnalis]|uniref:Protein-glucosylgalactosylhydroxylysine glucosidase n=1 Tax=Lymnaea stagnalis TaxID=6523 RepID=A0AAV2HQ99_LYMST
MTKLSACLAFLQVVITAAIATLVTAPGTPGQRLLHQHRSNRQIHDGLFTINNQNPQISMSRIQPLPPGVVPEDATVLTSDSMPANTKYVPEVGNGHLATVVQSDTIFMNGLYNGANITSHRARIPSTAGYSVTPVSPPGLTRKYTLDIGRGVFTESHAGPGVSVSLRTYAHRQLTRALVNELILTRDDIGTDVEVMINLNTGPASVDVEFTNGTMGSIIGTTLAAEFPEISPRTKYVVELNTKMCVCCMLYVSCMVSFTSCLLNVFEYWQFFISVKQIVYKINYMFDKTQRQFLSGQLLANHVQGWNQIWQKGRVDVKGDITIARHNYGCFYYIFSSLPFNGNRKDWPFIGLSPGGLAHGVEGKDYYGHVFWDQDTWMFPPIALLHPDLGRTIVETRTKTLKTAQIWAKESGYEGARFPWESAYTGLETCPAIPVGVMEVHINGDVAMMVRQYWQLTQDRQLMVNASGAGIVWETAKYWASRATYTPKTDTYSIYKVMPPDEFHSPVNDSAYTNNIASINLRFANQLAREFNQPENSTWAEISDKLRLLYDPVLDYHPEFDGYSLNDRTKQADVVLLGFPLMVAMNETTRRNDMIFYEQVNYRGSTPVGPAPAMTWGAFIIGWLELGEEAKAADLFNRSVLNSQQPFLVWSEDADGGGATNFLTGMGGYLQMILFGYGGCRIYDDMLTFNPILITRTTEVTFTGIDYRNCSFDLGYDQDNMTLTQTSDGQSRLGLEVKFQAANRWQKLITGQATTVKRQEFAVRAAQ